MNDKLWYPQAIKPETLSDPIHVFHDRVFWENHIKGVIPTVDATGVRVMPWEVEVGDLIGFGQVCGTDRWRVEDIEFTASKGDVPGWHRKGSFRFTTDKGYLSVSIDGNNTQGMQKLYWYQEIKQP